MLFLATLWPKRPVSEGFQPTSRSSNGTVVIVVKVNDNDLQSMRDRVDELLVAFSALEEAHEG